MVRMVLGCLLIVACGAGPWGCNLPLPEEFGTDISEVNRIRDDNSLTPQEKRAALADLGLSPEIINSVLRGTRTANQYGGDLRTAYEKVVGQRLDQLTPDEVQLYADAARDTTGGPNYNLTDEQAQAIVNALQDYHLATKADLAEFLEDQAKVAALPATVPDNALRDLFIEFDPEQLLDQLP